MQLKILITAFCKIVNGSAKLTACLIIFYYNYYL